MQVVEFYDDDTCGLRIIRRKGEPFEIYRLLYSLTYNGYEALECHIETGMGYTGTRSDQLTSITCSNKIQVP